MSIIREHQYSFACDPSLSWRARGVLFYAAAHPEDPITVANLVGMAGQGRKFGKESAAKTINEIIKAGYASAVGTDQFIYVKGKIPEAMREAVLRRDGGRCVECGSNKRLCVDHIIPEAKGGLTIESNLQAMCRPCNSEKSDSLTGGAQ